MRKIINEKLYDTNTATEVCSNDIRIDYDETFLHEYLYKKQTGEFFIFREISGDKALVDNYIFTETLTDEPTLFFMSRVNDEDMLNSYRLSLDYQFEPLSVESAKLWMELYASVDDYEKEFELPEE